jgi:hypothetical protein
MISIDQHCLLLTQINKSKLIIVHVFESITELISSGGVGGTVGSRSPTSCEGRRLVLYLMAMEKS